MSFDRLKCAYTPTGFVDLYTSEQWLTLSDAYQACSHDITPNHWTERQIDDALAYHLVPQWDNEDSPIHYPEPFEGRPRFQSPED